MRQDVANYAEFLEYKYLEYHPQLYAVSVFQNEGDFTQFF